MTTRRLNRACTAPGCRKYALERERYCATHQGRNAAHGHPLGSTPSDKLRRGYTDEARQWIARTLPLPPTQAALRIADETLRINPRPEAKGEADAQGWLIRAVDAGLTPQGLLERTVGMFWLIDDQHDGFGYRYSVEQENVTIAKWVLRVAPRPAKTSPRLLASRYLGDQLRRGLGRYAKGLLAYRRETEAVRRSLIDASASFPSPQDNHHAP